jgi:Pathogenicity locus
MKSTDTEYASELEDIPNIGKSIAADLREVGIQRPQQLLTQEPLALYLKLAGQMGKRHDPCVLYTLLAAQHFMQSGEKLAWWTFTGQGKKLLASYVGKHAERIKR